MTASSIYAGVEEPDVASVEAGGEFFECTVFRNVARNSIDAVIEVHQPDGQKVIVWSGMIRDVAVDGSGTGDCPKVLALDSAGRFVAHWIEGEEGVFAIHRATFDVQQIANGWTYRLSQTIQSGWGIYDHAPVRGSSPSEFVVCWISGTQDIGGLNFGILNIARYESPHAWTDTVWSQTYAAVALNRVLALVADDDADGVVGCAYQSGAAGPTYTLNVLEADSDTGLNFTGTTVSTGMPNSEYAAVGMAQYPNVSDCVIMAEYAEEADQAAGGPYRQYLRGVMYRDIDLGNNAAPLTSVQTLPNAHLVSRPWVKTDGFSDYEVYAAISFKSVLDTLDWQQTYGYVCRFNRYYWSAGRAAFTVRPVPCLTLTNGSFDGRAHGRSPNSGQLVGSTANKRMNHLSSIAQGPQYALGPDAKSVAFAALHFEQDIASQDADISDGERTRAQASVKKIRFYHEDPWTVRETNDGQPALPVAENYRSYSPYRAGRAIEMQAGLVFEGGVMSVYDGQQLVEVGYLWGPEIFSSVATGTGTLSGTYWVTYTYTWVDRKGTVHRGPPAVPVEVVADSDLEFTHVLRCINLTLKDDRLLYPDAPLIFLEVWRTAIVDGAAEGDGAGSRIFRRVFTTQSDPIQDTPENDATEHYITVVEGTTDDALQYADLLPWQLDTETLQWTPAVPIVTQSCRALARWQNRAFWVSHDDPRVIWYSDEQLPIGLQTAALETFATNRYRFDSRGEIVAMQEMDNDLIIFTRDGVYALTGEGNDGTGTGATLALQAVSGSTGCLEPSSVVLTPAGILFQSDNKGIYLLDRGKLLDHASVGAALYESMKTIGNVRDATLLRDRHIVRFAANRQAIASVEQPILLDFDYEQRRWAEHPMQDLANPTTRRNAMQAGTEWRGRQGQNCYIALQQDGLAVERADDDTVFEDDTYLTARAVPLDILTEWVHVGGLDGVKRVWQIGVQTERVNDGPMSVDVWYDVDNEVDFDLSTPDDTFSWDSPAPAKLKIRPRVQKCTSFRLRVYESGTVPSTENVRLVAISVETMSKPGASKLPVGNIGV